MKWIKGIFVLLFLGAFTLPVFAQELPGSAVEVLGWIVTAAPVLAGIVVSALVSRIRWVADLANWFTFLPEEFQSQTRKTLLLAFSLGLSWLGTQLLPFAQDLDNSGLWVVFIAIAGTSHFTHLLNKLATTVVDSELTEEIGVELAA
ncbi:MAG: hypothetical protein AAF485_16690 [Chloroflexota bacterium]